MHQDLNKHASEVLDGHFNERFDVNYCVDRKKGSIFPVCLLLKKMKLVDMLGIFGGRSDMVDNNYIGVPLQL